MQGALANVHKHASATKVCVSLQTDGKILGLKIGDNGLGFKPDNIHISSPLHFGLSIMSERAETIGADFNVDTKPGAGTRIMVRLPLKELP